MNSAVVHWLRYLLSKVGPLVPFLMFLFVSTSSLSFHYFYFSHNPLSFPCSLLRFIFPKFPHHSLSPHNLSSMLLAKSEGSFGCKGREITVNDPPIEAEKDKETLHSESDHFDKEEGSRNPGSECPPLINLWYATHSHFLVVPADHSLPPPGRVWLSLERRDSNIS